MSCCGDKRASLRRFSAMPNDRGYALAEALAATRVVTDAEDRSLRYCGPEPIVLRGPASGRVYACERDLVLGVHPQDVEALLRTGCFVLP